MFYCWNDAKRSESECSRGSTIVKETILTNCKSVHTRNITCKAESSLYDVRHRFAVELVTICLPTKFVNRSGFALRSKQLLLSNIIFLSYGLTTILKNKRKQTIYLATHDRVCALKLNNLTQSIIVIDDNWRL